MPKNVVCKKCNNLVNDWCDKVIKYTCGAGTPEEAETNCTYFIRGECTASFCEYRRKKRTNADYIRAMSDEELAAWIASMTTVCECCAEINECESPKCFNKCLHGVEDWLQQPPKLERNKSNRNMAVVEV